MTDDNSANTPVRSSRIRNPFETSRRSLLRRLGLTSSALAMPGTALASDSATPTEDVDVHRNLVFAERSDVIAGVGGHEEGVLRLDLHRPTQQHAHPSPVIVFIHGGAWEHGSKDNDIYDEVFSHWAEQGFAVASIEYRLSQEATFPAQIHDVNAAIRWVRAHASEYELDPANIGTFGPSAGGHLAALAGVTNGVDEFEGDGPNSEYSSDVQAAVSWFGIHALHELSGDEGSPESRLVGEPINENPEAGRNASPITYFDQDGPPLLLYHGTADRIVSAEQSELMYEKAREICHDTTLYLLDGLGHGTEDFHSTLVEKPPAEATVKTVHCRPADNAPDQRTKEGPIASLTDMERFYRRTLHD